jgi:dynactin complex subunit
MKVLDLPAGYQILISNEQSELLDKFDETDIILKRQLTEREQVLASELVHKGVLTRCTHQDKLAYCKPRLQDVWRI